MDIKKLSDEIVKAVGGTKNISNVANCMTRLRITVKSENSIDDDKIKDIDGVLGLVHDKEKYYEVVVGPGKSKQCADYCKTLDFDADTNDSDTNSDNKAGDWKENKKNIKSKQKNNKVKDFLKIIGEIFVPLIPGIITAGLAAGFNSLLTSVYPDCTNDPVWGTVSLILKLVNVSFMTYITAWAGYRTSERFGGTPILGGMIGMCTCLTQINDIAALLHLDDLGFMGSILCAGRGGVIAAVLGGWAIAKVENWLHKVIHPNLDMVITPLIAIFVIVVPYVLVVMPLAGFISDGIAYVVEIATTNENIIVRIITGYVSAALFLPLVAMGMHHSLIAVYTVQLNTIGYVTLYPALCMGGFGQIGASIAIYQKAKKVKNIRLCKVIGGALGAGILGVGEPMIYGVTLPLGKPFFTAGLGAGFGGAFVMAMQCASTSWGPSGILAPIIITAGPNPPLLTAAYYLIGGLISVIMGYLISRVWINEKSVAEFN